MPPSGAGHRADDLTACLVTVTYGDRLTLLQQMLDACLRSQTISHVIIVDNGSSSDFSNLRCDHGPKIQIVHLGQNKGSASGYKVGISKALETETDLVWLMDDDNVPEKGAFELLVEEIRTMWSSHGFEKSAVLANRPSIHSDTVKGVRNQGRFKKPSSFFGFHLAQLPGRIFSRLAWVNRTGEGPAAESIELPTACYGGFLAHRRAYQFIGLPFEDLVLYSDDDEYTSRLVRYGGKIRLVVNALTQDIDSFEDNRDLRKSSTAMSILHGSDFRVYYSFRNHSWIDHFINRERSVTYDINRIVYTLILFAFSLCVGRLDRFKVIVDAVEDGRRGRLGHNANYPLP